MPPQRGCSGGALLTGQSNLSFESPDAKKPTPEWALAFLVTRRGFVCILCPLGHKIIVLLPSSRQQATRHRRGTRFVKDGFLLSKTPPTKAGGE